MSNPTRNNHGGPPGPRSGHGHAHGLAHRAEAAAHVGGAAFEVAHGHPPVGMGFDLYRRATNALIQRAAPPGALDAPLARTVMRTRNLVLTGIGVGMTAYGVYQSWKHRNDDGSGHH